MGRDGSGSGFYQFFGRKISAKRSEFTRFGSEYDLGSIQIRTFCSKIYKIKFEIAAEKCKRILK
ncbi:hypothetical protein CH380_17010 [Leptospira adleri]|uniref:Uncharacterized protein n=1 Tax=Leptospira adleri TaxID=2023186 RepID=A0A2M9YKQ1_9LEPT|nr:hypothetical protein CH380_17010 [Leptospira adleri]PJZ59933.1 hypothetical protein CH376_21150 [Leptospira adleri]